MAKKISELYYKGLKKGDEVVFTRQIVGHPTKKLIGKIVGFNFGHNLGVPKIYHPLVHVKADCEYGSDLPYNHTLHVCEVTKV